MNQYQLVSIIVPCYNQGQYLLELFRNLQNQTYQSWECLIVDDGSDDATREVSELLIQQDTRIKYYFKENGGLSSARNFGIKRARGAYLQFLDADDLIDEEKFQLQLTSLAHSGGSAVAVSNYIPFVDGTSEYCHNRYMSPFLSPGSFKKEIVSEWEHRRSIPCHSFLIPKSFVDDNMLLFDEQLPNHEDWVFWCKLLYFVDQIIYQQEPLAQYRIRETSMCTNQDRMDDGFLMACDQLLLFYTAMSDLVMIDVVKRKKKEIKNFINSRHQNVLLSRLRQKIKKVLS